MKEIPECVICNYDSRKFCSFPKIRTFISEGKITDEFKDIKEKVLITCSNGTCESIYLFDPLTNDMELTTASWSKDACLDDVDWDKREDKRAELCKKWGAKVIK